MPSGRVDWKDDFRQPLAVPHVDSEDDRNTVLMGAKGRALNPGVEHGNSMSDLDRGSLTTLASK